METTMNFNGRIDDLIIGAVSLTLMLALLWHLYAHGAVLYAPGIQWSMRCVPRGVEW